MLIWINQWFPDSASTIKERRAGGDPVRLDINDAAPPSPAHPPPLSPDDVIRDKLAHDYTILN